MREDEYRERMRNFDSLNADEVEELQIEMQHRLEEKQERAMGGY